MNMRFDLSDLIFLIFPEISFSSGSVILFIFRQSVFFKTDFYYVRVNSDQQNCLCSSGYQFFGNLRALAGACTLLILLKFPGLVYGCLSDFIGADHPGQFLFRFFFV